MPRAAPARPRGTRARVGLVGRAPRRARPARPPPPSAPTRRAAGARWGAGAPVGGARARRWWLVRGAVGPRVMVNGFVTRVTKALPLPGSGLDRPYVLTRRVAARPVRRSRSRRAARAAPFTVNANTWCDTLVRPSVPVGARVACDAACVRGSRSFCVLDNVLDIIPHPGDLLPRACASTPRPLDVVNPQSPTRSAFSSDRVVVNRIISCSLRRHKPRRCPSLSSLSPCPSPHAWRGRLTAAPSSSASAFRTMPTNFSFDERCPIVIRSLVHRSGREPQ